MTRFYLLPIVLLVLLLTVGLKLIHEQPYDDHGLRQLLLPDGCPAPCFIGIRPGVTTRETAIKILNENTWVEKVETYLDSPTIKVVWNDKRPPWLENDSRYGGTTLLTKDDLVVVFTVSTNITLFTMNMSLERPPIQSVTHRDMFGSDALLYSGIYPDFGLLTFIYKSCYLDSKIISLRDKIYLNYADLSDVPHTSQQDYLAVIQSISTDCQQG